MQHGTMLEAGNLKLLKQFLFLECEKGELQEQLRCQSVLNKNVIFFLLKLV